MALPPSVKIVEVGPRDGLQNEPQEVSIDVKVGLIERLAAAGLQVIEAGSFVSPKWVPQMAGSDAVFARLGEGPSITYTALVPNMAGLERALAAGVREVAVFAAASETFSRRNINCSIDDSLARFAPVLAAAGEADVRVRGYVSCVLGCPYEGDVSPEAVARVATRLAEMGCYEISLGDTIGVGTPRDVHGLLDRVLDALPPARLAVHFHDTYGQALANVYAALEREISVVDAAVAGLGGCPYAPGAAGNVATEDVLYMLDGLGIETGVDLDTLIAAGMFISGVLDRPPGSKVSRARLRQTP